MQKLVCLIQAFSQEQPFGLELVQAYRQAATEAGHALHFIDIHALSFDPIVYPGNQALETDLQEAVQAIIAAQQLLIALPVYRDFMPTRSQGFFRKIFHTDALGRPLVALWGPHPDLPLKTARILSLLDHYSWQEFKQARTSRYHPLKKSVLEGLGFGKVYTTTIPPQYRNGSPDYHDKWIRKVAALGKKIS